MCIPFFLHTFTTLWLIFIINDHNEIFCSRAWQHWRNEEALKASSVIDTYIIGMSVMKLLLCDKVLQFNYLFSLFFFILCYETLSAAVSCETSSYSFLHLPFAMTQ